MGLGTCVEEVHALLAVAVFYEDAGVVARGAGQGEDFARKGLKHDDGAPLACEEPLGLGLKADVQGEMDRFAPDGILFEFRFLIEAAADAVHLDHGFAVFIRAELRFAAVVHDDAQLPIAPAEDFLVCLFDAAAADEVAHLVFVGLPLEFVLADFADVA